MRRPPAFLVVPCRECGQPRRVRNGAHLRALRERRGLSLREMARRLAWSASYLSDVERGRRAATPTVWACYRAILGEGMRRV